MLGSHKILCQCLVVIGFLTCSIKVSLCPTLFLPAPAHRKYVQHSTSAVASHALTAWGLRDTQYNNGRGKSPPPTPTPTHSHPSKDSKLCYVTTVQNPPRPQNVLTMKDKPLTNVRAPFILFLTLTANSKLLTLFPPLQ